MSAGYWASTVCIFLLGLPGIAAFVWFERMMGDTSWLVWFCAGLGVVVLAAMFAAVYCFVRPRGFEVSGQGVAVVWLNRRRLIPVGVLGERSAVRDMDLGRLAQKVGKGISVGRVFGTFGGFRSEYLQSMEVYITRREGMVMVRLLNRKPLLVTPADPAQFMAAVGAVTEVAHGKQPGQPESVRQ